MSQIRQFSLDFGHAPGLSRDDLVVSEANQTALQTLESWPDWPSPVVILAGPAGSGKSHLASIWRNLSKAQVLHHSSLAYSVSDAAAPILIDDADGGGVNEVELFHLINTVREQGSSMLMTARRFPAAWGLTLPDLVSRLRAATLVELGEPDDILLGGVVTKLFADRQVEVDPTVIQFMVRRMERSLSTASILVEQIDRIALERKSAVTRALAAELIAMMDQRQGSLDLDGAV